MSSGFEHSYHRASYGIRRKPAVVAGAAGAIGIVCGALAVGMWANASSGGNVAQRKPVETVGAAGLIRQEASPARIDISATTPQPAVATPADKPAAAEKAASSPVNAEARCEGQTWPYITQDCLTEPAGQRRVRVITTDKIAAPMISAIETSRAVGAHAAGKAARAPSTVKSGSPAPSAVTPPPGAAKPIEAHMPAREANVSSAAVAEQSSRDQATAAADANAAPAAAPAEPTQQRLSAKEARKQARDKRKREVRSRGTPPPDVNDEDSVSRVSAFAERDAAARNRIAERWTEREYDVPSYDGTQRRRVIVIRRNNDTSGVYMPSPGSYWRSVFQH